jgi:DNA-binding LacI/PurR family transcriptional regulator
MKRPTLKDIAAIAGVSHVAVSMALRDHPRIAAQTRKRIKKIARQIGYRPDPALSALSAYRREAKKPKYQATLAWVNFYNTPVESQEFSFGIFKGAQKRCTQLGYVLEEFRLADMDSNMRRLSAVLYSRNIQGVLLASQTHPNAHITQNAFAWNRFSVITFGFTLSAPKLDVVIDAQYQEARLAIRKLKALGYRRIGFVINSRYNEQTNRNLLAGYLCEQISSPVTVRIPPLILNSTYTADHAKQCREWVQNYKPDGIFDTNANLLNSLSPAELGRYGIAVHGRPNKSEVAGICQNLSLIGWVGANEVITMINVNVRGIPTYPRHILIEGTWADGVTAPRVLSSESNKALVK